MESGAGRSSEERAAAAEARRRRRAGEDPRTGDEQLMRGAGEPARAPDDVIHSATGGLHDVYARRRLIAIGAAVIVVLFLFLLVAGC